LRLDVVFFHEQTGPYAVHQDVFCDQFPIGLSENAKQIERATAQRDRLAAALKRAAVKIEAERAEGQWRPHLPRLAGSSAGFRTFQGHFRTSGGRMRDKIAIGI
jgi:hypothetical protein